MLSTANETTNKTVPTTLFEPVEKQISNFPKDWKSIFIPRISFDISKNALRVSFEETFPIGKVHRIDFVEVRPENGAGRMAFVHFDYWYDSIQSKNFRNTLETDEFADMFGFRVLINKKPVPPSDLNIDQLTDAQRILQDKFDEFKEQTIKIIMEQHKQISDLYWIIIQNGLTLPSNTSIPNITNDIAKEINNV